MDALVADLQKFVMHKLMHSLPLEKIFLAPHIANRL
jgi:hypothetical protein